MADTIDNSMDVIDSRDVIARIEELESELCPSDESDGTDNQEREELATLVALADEASGYAADWQYGEALIRDSYFENYAQELAEDIGAIDNNASWPNNYIDWERAARELQMDYTAVDFDGVTYWIR
jgi:antirestriction protein